MNVRLENAEKYLTEIAPLFELGIGYCFEDLADIVEKSIEPRLSVCERIKRRNKINNKIRRACRTVRYRHKLWDFIRPEYSFESIKIWRSEDKSIIHEFDPKWLP